MKQQPTYKINKYQLNLAFSIKQQQQQCYFMADLIKKIIKFISFISQLKRFNSYKKRETIEN